MKSRSPFALYTLLSFVLLGLGACQKHDQKPLVRFCNFMADSDSLWANIDNWVLSGKPVAYRQTGPFIDYVYDNDGSQNLVVKSATSPNTWINTTINLANYKSYNVFTTYSVLKPDLLVLETPFGVSGYKSYVRMVNLLGNNKSVAVRLYGTPKFSATAYLKYTDYLEVEPGAYYAEAVDDNGRVLVADTVKFNSISSHSLIISGVKDAATANKYDLKITVIKDYPL
ncbi:MAG: hypothetical protein U0T84_10830 [Chitinophagales bacterium]